MTKSTLPERPHLDHLRGQAKALLKAARVGDAQARRRLGAYFDPTPHEPKLHQAQLTIAREYGYPSWRELGAHIKQLRAAAQGLVVATVDGDVDAMSEILDRHPGLVRTVVDRDNGPMPADSPEMGLLHLCAANDQPQAAKLLIERGAQLELRNRHGRTVLHDSLEYGRDAITQMVIASGADVDVCSAALMGDTARLRELVAEDPEVLSDTSTGLSVLGWASFGGNPEVLPFLAEHGVVIDAWDGLCPAAQCDHSAFIAKAIELGANPGQACGELRRTPLHEAVQLRFTSHATRSVTALLDAGVDVNARDAKGNTSMDLALAAAEDPRWPGQDHAAVIALLEARGAVRGRTEH